MSRPATLAFSTPSDRISACIRIAAVFMSSPWLERPLQETVK
jgi:hypothetical protein